jgi:integrase
MKRLMAFVHHDDMNIVTPDDLQCYKESLITLMRDGTWQPKTVDDHIEMIKAQFRWAKENRKITTNPAAELRMIGGTTDPRRARKDFDTSEIQKILTAAREAEPVIRWANWIAAFSGARLAEIVEADIRDVEITPQGAIFHIRLENRPPTQRLKGTFSERSIPLHSAIMAEGFAAYVGSLPTGPLFPTLRLDGEGRLANNASNIIMPWLRDKIGITDPRKVFHSWRHTFKTNCRGKIAEEIHDAITGHSTGSIGRSYGRYPMAVLREAIEKVTYQT